MFSTDKNIETIAELIEAVKNYIGLQTKYAKLDVIEKIVRLLTALTMLAVLLLLLFIGLIYLSLQQLTRSHHSLAQRWHLPALRVAILLCSFCA